MNHWGTETNDQALFDSWNQERFDKAKVCELCRERPPTDIMRYTSYCAVCQDCRDFLLADMARSREELARSDEEYYES